MHELKAILNEIVTDLEDIRIVIAARSAASGEKPKTAEEIIAGADREPYTQLRKRIDALKLDPQT
jgi:hypothetical protein